jgi:hypothetical protein
MLTVVGTAAPEAVAAQPKARVASEVVAVFFYQQIVSQRVEFIREIIQRVFLIHALPRLLLLALVVLVPLVQFGRNWIAGELVVRIRETIQPVFLTHAFPRLLALVVLVRIVLLRLLLAALARIREMAQPVFLTLVCRLVRVLDLRVLTYRGECF